MPRIETIKASDAPSPPQKASKAATEFMDAFNALKRDEVLRLIPDEGKSLRGIKTSVGRITKKQGVKVVSWDDGQALYVRRAS